MDTAIIFATNVRTILKGRGMSKRELSRLTDISLPFLSGILNHCRNVSLEKMTAISNALEVPLSLLFEHDWDAETCRKAGLFSPNLPKGYEFVGGVVLDRFKAHQVRKWDTISRKKINLPHRF